MNSPTLPSLSSRGSRLFVRAALPLALGFAAVAPLHAQKIATVAHYTFSNASSLFADSSGNGFTLNGTGVAGAVSQSTTEFSPSASTIYSAYFNGAQTGAASRQINFSNYSALTFDWHMKVDPVDVQSVNRTVMQLGPLSSSGNAVLIQLRWDSANSAASLYVSHRLSSGYAISSYLISDVGDWNNYTLTINNSVQTPGGHISLLYNGVALASISSSYQSGSTAGFVTNSSFTYLGNNGSSVNAPFKGYLQDLEIYSGTPIPEPASAVALIGMAGAFVGFGARRRR